MRVNDFIHTTFTSVREQPLRSFLTALGIAVGIGAVVLLTSLGEGLHRFVLAEFTQFGTNLIAINPGKKSTLGVSGAVISNVRPLSLDDAQALAAISGVLKTQPVIQGNASVKVGERQRRTTVFGVGPAVPEVWQIRVAAGHFLPDDPPRNARAYAVLGSRLRAELFKNEPFLGKRLRVGEESYRVVGGMESKGQMLGFDLDDAVYLPIAKVMAMFNRDSLMEIDLLYGNDHTAESIAAAAKKMLIKRHGSEDFTITTQEQMLETLGSVLNILTIAVGALGGISLFVGGVGIFTIMTIAVNERRAEIGLLCAIGATRRQVRVLFLGEAVSLALIGGGSRSHLRGRRSLGAYSSDSCPAHPHLMGVCGGGRNYRGGGWPWGRGVPCKPRRQPAAGGCTTGGVMMGESPLAGEGHNAIDLRGNTVHVTVRGEPVEPPATHCRALRQAQGERMSALSQRHWGGGR